MTSAWMTHDMLDAMWPCLLPYQLSCMSHVSLLIMICHVMWCVQASSGGRYQLEVDKLKERQNYRL